MLQKVVYPYEYKDDWEKFNKKSLSEKKDFYGHLNMKYITDADHAHPKWNCKDFEIRYLGKYHDFYVQSNTLFLADPLENLRNVCLKICKFDVAKSLLPPGLAWQIAFKKRPK